MPVHFQGSHVFTDRVSKMGLILFTQQRVKGHLEIPTGLPLSLPENYAVMMEQGTCLFQGLSCVVSVVRL